MSEITLRLVIDLDDRIIDLLTGLKEGGQAATVSTPAPAGKKKTPPPPPEEPEETEQEATIDADSVKELATSIASQSEENKAKVKALIKKVGKADSLPAVKEANLEKLHAALTELQEELENAEL